MLTGRRKSESDLKSSARLSSLDGQLKSGIYAKLTRILCSATTYSQQVGGQAPKGLASTWTALSGDKQTHLDQIRKDYLDSRFGDTWQDLDCSLSKTAFRSPLNC